MLEIALILIAMITLVALELWAFWTLGEHHENGRERRRHHRP